MSASAAAMERRSGVALWRQIADQIRLAIVSGDFTDRLPPETALAAQFGVNRHTVRGAIAALVQEGVLRAEQGRGTFVEAHKRFAYPIGPRTRFSEGLEGQARERRGMLLGHFIEPADGRVAGALKLAEGAGVIRLEAVSEADGRRVSRSTSYFDASRFAGIDKAYARNGSITAAFREFGVADYFRRSTLVSARHAAASDLSDLRLSPGAIVLVTVYVNVDPEGVPVQFSETRFAADLVELSVS